MHDLQERKTKIIILAFVLFTGFLLIAKGFLHSNRCFLVVFSYLIFLLLAMMIVTRWLVFIGGIAIGSEMKNGNKCPSYFKPSRRRLLTPETRNNRHVSLFI